MEPAPNQAKYTDKGLPAGLLDSPRRRSKSNPLTL